IPMWRDKTVAVVIPTQNEKDSIRATVLEFFDAGMVDEIVVVNNNAAQGTSNELEGTGVIEVFERRRGIGSALLSGIDHCLEHLRSDFIVLAQADGAFTGQDLLKLMAYSDDVPVVFGTRTTGESIWGSANLGKLQRWANRAIAKMTARLFN